MGEVALEAPVPVEAVVLEVVALLPAPEAVDGLDAVPVIDDELTVGAAPGAAGAPAAGPPGWGAGGGAACEPPATCASLLTETVVWCPLWSTVLVCTPSSTRVIVSLPNLRTVTLGACALAEDAGEEGDGEPVVEAAGVGVDEPDAGVAAVVLAPAAPEGGASLVTETVVRRPFWSMVVVCVPSSTLVIVSLPNLCTVMLGACAPAGAEEGALVEEAGGAAVAEAQVVEADGAAEADGVEEAGGAGVAEAEVGEAAGAEAVGVVVGALEVVGEALELVGRGGGGDGSAPAVPAGVAAAFAWAPV